MKMMISGVNPPARKTIGSCGYDLYCPEDIEMSPYDNEWLKIDLGIKLDVGDIPDGYCGLIMPRSSIGMKYGLKLSNTIGVIDSDYTMDTIKAALKVDCTQPIVRLQKNERILQMVIVPFGIIPSEQVPTQQRTGGIGSTGA